MLKIFLYLSIITTSVLSSTIYHLPEIKYNDLVSLEYETSQGIVQALTDVGALQITGIPRFSMLRKRALEDLADCFDSEATTPALEMKDGSRRMSCGAASHRGVSGEMSSICGEAASKLRAVVDATTRQLFLSLDVMVTEKRRENERQRRASPLLMGPTYKTFHELMSEGEHLEHLHSYIAGDEQSKLQASSIATLDFHVDAGLMIAMTTGYYAKVPASETSGLYLELRDGSRVKVQANDDALIILMGDGGSRWLNPVLGSRLRAPPHALIADLQSEGASRSWYGKMYLPPTDAIIPQESISFKDFHRKLSQHSSPLTKTTSETNQAPLQDMLPSACGGNFDTYKATVGDACGSDEIWCWSRCMSTADLSCGTSAVCYNFRDDELMNGNSHCMGGDDDTTGGIFCGPACVKNATYGSGFCRGEGTSMFMEGFVSLVEKGEGKTDCVNLLFSDWTLDTKGKYAAGCIGVFFMCILIQYLAKLRVDINNQWKDSIIRRVMNLVLYAGHVTLGYFAMLVAMTYSVELFCMICSGLIAGFALFHLSDPLALKSTDPCCGDTEEKHKMSSAPSSQSSLYQPLNVSDHQDCENRSGTLRSVVSSNNDESGNCCGNPMDA